MNFFGKVEKRGSINERLHFFAKDEKGYPFYQFVLVGTRRKRVSFFLSILMLLEKIGKCVKFQDITPIKATFTNTIDLASGPCILGKGNLRIVIGHSSRRVTNSNA